MPVLPLEPFVYPEELLVDSPFALDGSGSWWVLRTRPRTEKSLARRCLALELPFFLPLHSHQNYTQKRRQTAHLPLFPGYMFLHGDGDARRKALETNLVAQCLTVSDQLRFHDDLRRVYRLITGAVEFCPEDNLQPGLAVQITEGIFAGLTGTILRRGSQLRFVVEIEILRQGVSIEVKRGMFQPV